LAVRLGMELIDDLASAPLVLQPMLCGIEVQPGEPVLSVQLLDDGWFGQSAADGVQTISSAKVTRQWWVNSFHHQAVRFKAGTIPPGVNIIAVADTGWEHDPLIVELMQGAGWLSVQWHPEFDWELSANSRYVLERFRDDFLSPDRPKSRECDDKTIRKFRGLIRPTLTSPILVK
jgi:hypothetical protein